MNDTFITRDYLGILKAVVSGAPLANGFQYRSSYYSEFSVY